MCLPGWSHLYHYEKNDVDDDDNVNVVNCCDNRSFRCMSFLTAPSKHWFWNLPGDLGWPDETPKQREKTPKNYRKTKNHEERTWLFHHKFHLMFLIGFCVCCSSPPVFTSILQEVFFFLTTSLPVSDLTIQYTHNGWGNFSFCYVVFLLRKSETLVNPPLSSLNIPSGDETNACCSQSPKKGFCRHPYGVVVPSSFQKKSCENCYERSHIIHMYHILVYIDIVVYIVLHFPQKSNVGIYCATFPTEIQCTLILVY